MAKGEYWKPEGFDSIANAAKIKNLPLGALHRAVREGALKTYTVPANRVVRFVNLDEVDAAFTPRPAHERKAATV